MTGLVLSIYRFFKRYPLIGVTAFIIITLALVGSVMTLHYNEDISDFLPLDEENSEALDVYRRVSGADKIIAMVMSADTDSVDASVLAAGIESLSDNISVLDSVGAIRSMMQRVDMENMMDIADEVYANIPYFLTEKDYCTIDSLLSTPDYVAQQMRANREMLLLPTGNLITQNISRDPLNLFSDVLNRLSSGSVGMDYDTYDGYILTPDRKRGLVIIESSYGANESEHNTYLTGLLNAAADSVAKAYPQLQVRYVGGPVIAVENASRIKKDSILAITIAGLLIVALLIYVFRSVRSILLIIISVAWGWLFAVGIIAIFYDSISIIVIGIASIILGIAVNYPLHLIDHLKSTPDIKSCLREIVAPLAVGNITTVGAFLCLVPLNAPALHDLGLFGSLLLVGTIIFVLLFLPHLVRSRRFKNGEPVNETPDLISRISGISIEKNRWIIYTMFILTAVFAVFAFHTEFDSDMRHINYMSDQQREDLEYLSTLTSAAGNDSTHQSAKPAEQIFIVSKNTDYDKAVLQFENLMPVLSKLQNRGKVTFTNHVADFIHSSESQESDLNRWNQFLETHPDILSSISSAGAAAGFSDDAFMEFSDLLSDSFSPKPIESFEQLGSTVFASNLLTDLDSDKKMFVVSLNVNQEDLDEVMETLHNATATFTANRSTDLTTSGSDRLFAFDVKGMNTSITNSLSDDFNYIGVACSLIVFIFLWISLGSLELAIISFIPMAVSWIWILGIMGIAGIKFNIVNIILATFIFGQGDDYTIFMTEGLTYEFAYRKKMLASFKNSIIISALIMFIGIGTLIIAEHPAMKSLGEVTVVGMLSVVLMAYFFPPFIFNWLVRNPDGSLRRSPITISGFLSKLSGWGKYHRNPDSEILNLAFSRYLYKGREIERRARKNINRIAQSGIPVIPAETDEYEFICDLDSQGEIALITALKYPECKIKVILPTDLQYELLRGCAQDLVSNLTISHRKALRPDNVAGI